MCACVKHICDDYLFIPILSQSMEYIPIQLLRRVSNDMPEFILRYYVNYNAIFYQTTLSVIWIYFQ